MLAAASHQDGILGHQMAASIVGPKDAAPRWSAELYSRLGVFHTGRAHCGQRVFVRGYHELRFRQVHDADQGMAEPMNEWSQCRP